MKKQALILLLSLALVLSSFLLGQGSLSNTDGFPKDFPHLMDTGGYGQGSLIHGFGGNLSFDQKANQAAVKRNPVILIHGNGGNAHSAQWGMLTMHRFLKEWGYNDSEIWAFSYLGADNSSAELPNPHTSNIDDVRSFIDAVREYLGVQKVDLVGHSLGGGMIRSYLHGLQRDGSFQKSERRFDAVGTIITMAAGNYGLGFFSLGEFQTGSAFEKALHIVDGVYDDTPYGATSGQKGSYNKTTSLDNNSITYVALWANGDFVESQHFHTGRLEGAHLNRGYDLGASLTGHERIIKDKEVFTDMFPYLNTNPNTPPEPEPPTVSISPDGGKFQGSIKISIQATNKPSKILYSLNASDWKNYQAPFEIKENTIVKAKADNKHGASLEISASFTKLPTPNYKKVKDNATGHYLAGRIGNSQYVTLGMKYGFIQSFYLYEIEGAKGWTDIKPE